MQFEQLETDYMKCLDEVLCKLEELLKSHFELSEGLMTSYYEGDNHRHRYLNLNNSGVESSLKEVRALIEEIYGKHIQYHYHYEFIETLSDEFTRISKWNVRLDDLKKEMLSHLNLVVEKFFAFSKHIDFEETALSLEKSCIICFNPSYIMFVERGYKNFVTRRLSVKMRITKPLFVCEG